MNSKQDQLRHFLLKNIWIFELGLDALHGTILQSCASFYDLCCVAVDQWQIGTWDLIWFAKGRMREGLPGEEHEHVKACYHWVYVKCCWYPGMTFIRFPHRAVIPWTSHTARPGLDWFKNMAGENLIASGRWPWSTHWPSTRLKDLD